MLLKIDAREQELIKTCEYYISIVPAFKDIKLVVENLPLGDILLSNEKNDLLIIERKTVADLVASIKDGRYEEQSYRLNGLSHHNHNIIYLIEGDITKYNMFREKLDKMTIYSAIFSINYFKGFSIMRSMNLDETATILCNMAYKVAKTPEEKQAGYYSKPEEIEEPTEKEYCNVIKKIKKENITTGNIGEIMLCQIPGVSSSTALAILDEFKTLPNLIKMIQENENCLSNICTTDTKNKSRKISKTTIAKIVEFLKA